MDLTPYTSRESDAIVETWIHSSQVQVPNALAYFVSKLVSNPHPGFLG